MKVTATTLPCRSWRASRVPPCVVRLNAGAGPIFGRSALSPTAWLSESTSQLTTASVMRLLPCHLCHLFMPPPSHTGGFFPPQRGERSPDIVTIYHPEDPMRTLATPSAPSSAH